MLRGAETQHVASGVNDPLGSELQTSVGAEQRKARLAKSVLLKFTKKSKIYRQYQRRTRQDFYLGATGVPNGLGLYVSANWQKPSIVYCNTSVSLLSMSLTNNNDEDDDDDGNLLTYKTSQKIS